MEYEKFTSPKKQICSCNNLFLTQYYNGKGEKICTYAIPYISQEPHKCGKLSGVQIFVVQVTIEKWPQDHYFSQKVLLVGTHTRNVLSMLNILTVLSHTYSIIDIQYNYRCLL